MSGANSSPGGADAQLLSGRCGLFGSAETSVETPSSARSRSPIQTCWPGTGWRSRRAWCLHRLSSPHCRQDLSRAFTPFIGGSSLLSFRVCSRLVLPTGRFVCSSRAMCFLPMTRTPLAIRPERLMEPSSCFGSRSLTAPLGSRSDAFPEEDWSARRKASGRQRQAEAFAGLEKVPAWATSTRYVSVAGSVILANVCGQGARSLDPRRSWLSLDCVGHCGTWRGDGVCCNVDEPSRGDGGMVPRSSDFG